MIIGYVLLALGVAVFVLSFVIPAKTEEEKATEFSEELIKDMVGKEVEEAKSHLNDIVDETVTYAMEKTERSIDRLTNEKIMAVDEYSETVLKQINDNHQEAVFLYDMLNDKDAVADQDTGALDFTLNYGTGDSYRVQIFSSDPTQNAENCYILAYYILNDDSTTELLCNLPENINNLYVGVTDKEGNRVVKSVAMLNGKANVVFGTLMASSK